MNNKLNQSMKVWRNISDYVFGLSSSDALPSIGLQLLEEGYDSPSLRQLAGYSASDAGECRELFTKTLIELGIILPSLSEAGLSVARGIAAEVLQETITPYIGAKRIWSRVYNRLPDLEQLRPFVGLASEHEDDVHHREEYARDIINECHKLLNCS